MRCSSWRTGVAVRDACALWVGGDAALVGMNLLPTEVGEGARARVAVAHVRAERGRRADRLACAFHLGADATLVAGILRDGVNLLPTELGEGARARVAVAHVRAERGRRADRLACAFRVGADAAFAPSILRNDMNVVTPEARVAESVDMRGAVAS